METSSDSLSPVELLAEDFLDRQQRGENPTIDEYCRRHPELEDEIRDVFEGFLLIEGLKPGSDEISQAATGDRQLDGKRLDRVGDYRIIREVGRGGMGIVYEAEQESLRRRVALKVLPKQQSSDEKSLQRFQREARAAARMHHTNIVPVFEVGQDDQWVFYAMQLIHGQGLDLVIDDLKRIRTEHSLLKGQKSDRSNASAGAMEPPAHSIAASLIAGRFRHEDLADESDGPEISAAEKKQSQTAISDSEALRAYAETTVEKSGSTVSAVLPGQSEISSAESNRNRYFHSVAQVGLQTARALSYAHARGIIHRDIKPSNLLLDAAGIVWVTDFGLAKTGDEAMTHTGDILGTIRYMSPERFRGQCDVRADIYSLGLTLYEMLVLKPAFSSPDRLRLIEMVTKAEPALPRSLDPKIPRDLETIVLKCIDKDARRRYQSADELADDLQRFVDDEPIRARRISLAERLGRWSRRNKGLATSLAVVAMLLLIINIAGPMLTWRMSRLNNNLAATVDQLEATQAELRGERDVANALRMEAENERRAAQESERRVRQQQELTRRNLYFSHIHMAQAAQATGDFTRREELLNQWRTSDRADDLRGFEWYYLSTQGETSHRILRGHTRDIRAVAWSPDGSRFASGARDKQVIIWDAATGRIRQTLTGHLAGIWGIDWSPDGTRLATASTDSSIRIWDSESGQELFALDPHSHYVFDVAWSPDGRQLASASWDKTVRIWDATTGKELATLDHAENRMWCVAWHPSGERVATGGSDDSVIRVWDVAARQIVESYTADGNDIASLAWHRDGNRLASSNSNGDVFIWERGKQNAEILTGSETETGVHEVAWHPIEKDLLLASSGDGDRTLLIWNVTREEKQLTLQGHEGGIRSGRWSPDGTKVLSCSGDRTLRLWDISALLQQSLPDHHDRPVEAFDWSSDGGLIATASGEESIKIWVNSGTKLLHELVKEEAQEETRCVGFRPDGKRLASGSGDGFVRLWDVHSGELVWRSEQNHEPQKGNPQNHGIECLAWHPNGSTLVSGGQDNMVRIWDASTGKLLNRVQTKWSATYSLCYSPDGRWLASGHWTNTPVLIWDTATWTLAAELDDRGIQVRSVQFSPDGEHLVAAGGREAEADNPLSSKMGVIRVWEMAGDYWTSDAESVTEIRSQSWGFADVSWSPDGRRLVSTTGNGAAQLWDVSNTRAVGLGRELLKLPSRSGYRVPVGFSPDGSRIAVALHHSVVTYDAFSGYAREKSPQLLPTLDARIRANTATVDDYLLRADVFAAQGKWDQAAEVYEKYYERDDTEPWILSDTWVAGYFPGDLDTAYEPERADAAGEIDLSTSLYSGGNRINWMRIETEAGSPLVFNRALGPSQRSTAYAFQRIYSPQAQEVGILFGDDDYHRLWVNQELVSEDRVTGPANPQEFAVPVTLRPGWNSILAKVVNAEGESHGMFLRLTNDAAELAAAYEQSGQYDRAAASWDRAFENQPTDKSLLLNRATARWRAGDKAGAEADFEVFLSGRETDATALEQRAKAYLDLGLIEEGHEDYDRAVAANPDWLSLRWRCMSAKMYWNRPHEAAEHLKYLQEHDPTEHHHYFWLAPVLLELGDVAGYRDVRDMMLRRWSRETNAMLAERTALVCLLLPAGEEDLATAFRLAVLATQSKDFASLHWYFMVAAGLAKYRQGEWAEMQGDLDLARQYFNQAHVDLETAIAKLPSDAVNKRVQARFVLAANAFHLDSEDAGALLTAAESEYREIPELNEGMADIYMCRVLRAEATEKILGRGYQLLDQAERLITEGKFDAAMEQIEAATIASPESESVVGRAALLVYQLLAERTEVLSPTSESEPVQWQYRFTPPPSGWTSGLESDGWLSGPAPFSTRERANTPWLADAPEVWIRREFELPAVPGGGLQIRLLVDDIAEVYLNGEPIIQQYRWTTNDYAVIDCPTEATHALRAGVNVLAVHASNNLAFGGQPASEVDAGLQITRDQDLWREILERAIAAAPDALPLIKYRAYDNVRQERYLEAGLDYVRFAPISDQPENHLLNTASLLALSGDVTAYRNYCNALLVEHADLTDPVIASKLIKTCLLIPGAIEPDRLPIGVLRRAADSSEQEREPWWCAWAHAGLALAAYRSGDLGEAERRIGLVEAIIGERPASAYRALICPLKAMIEHHRQNNGRGVLSDAAQESLRIAKASIDFQGIRRSPNGTLLGSSLLSLQRGLQHNAIIGELLRREAERLVGQKTPSEQE